MDENEILTPEEEIQAEDIMPDFPEDDPEEWERKRREEWEAKPAPFKALRQTINEHDELMVETLYEVTLLELGEMEE